jgi:hypothetical protein
MVMNEFCLYSLAAACLVWGVLGLRFALSIVMANAVLLLLMCFLPAPAGHEYYPGLAPVWPDPSMFAAGSDMPRHILMLAWPLYWGLAFAALRVIDRVNWPSLSVPPRLALGCAAALILMLCANWAPVSREARLFAVTYLTSPRERAARLADFLREGDERRRCDTSYATLMTLALNARDREVTGVFITELAACDAASATFSEVVRPILDNGDAASLEFLIQCGLTPDMEVFGHDYANGTALAYAAIANRPEMVRLLAASAPERVRGMKYLDSLLRALKERDSTDMLSVLSQMGLEQPDP